jgi:hypothetical protein
MLATYAFVAKAEYSHTKRYCDRAVMARALREARAKADIIGICRELKGAMQGASDKALLERARQAWEDTMRLLGRPEAYGQVLAVACAALRETTLDV